MDITLPTPIGHQDLIKQVDQLKAKERGGSWFRVLADYEEHDGVQSPVKFKTDELIQIAQTEKTKRRR